VTGKLYAFQTHEYAKMFFDIVTKYEQSRFHYGSITSGKYSTVPSEFNKFTVTPSFIFNLGGEQYKLNLGNKPNLVQRFVLKLLGFKKN
jgi:hypothetical protein